MCSKLSIRGSKALSLRWREGSAPPPIAFLAWPTCLAIAADAQGGAHICGRSLLGGDSNPFHHSATSGRTSKRNLHRQRWLTRRRSDS